MNQTPSPAKRIPAGHLEFHIESLRQCIGDTISISESVCRHRTSGPHDQRYSTRSTLRFELREVRWSLGGSELSLACPPDFSYGISCESLVSLQCPDKRTLIFTEHFEAQVERLTTVHITNFRTA